MSTARQVCDGWDVRALTSTGAVTLHFQAEPDAVEIAAAVAAYEAAQVVPVESVQTSEYAIVCEDGTYA